MNLRNVTYVILRRHFLKELTKFTSTRGYVIGSPNALSSVKFVDGLFNYSVRYTDGRISLSHIFLSSATKAEQDGAEQLATASESKSEGEKKSKLEWEGRSQ